MAYSRTKEMKSILKSFRPSMRSTTPEPLRQPEGIDGYADAMNTGMASSNHSRNLAQPPTPLFDQPLVLIELFQSQGCNACPPTNDNLVAFIETNQHSSSSLAAPKSPPRFYADRSLAPSSRPSTSMSSTGSAQEYLLLTYQVTYWNYLGWNDTFSLPENDSRQREYVRRMGLKAAYTPMVVVNGRGVGVGKTKSDLDHIVREGTKSPHGEERKITLTKILDDVDVEDVRVEIDATALFIYSSSQSYSQATTQQPLEVYEITYIPTSQDVHVSRGENAGRTLTHLNIVKDMKRIGYLERGAKGKFRVEGSGRRRGSHAEERVVVVQDGKGGQILGVLRV